MHIILSCFLARRLRFIIIYTPYDRQTINGAKLLRPIARPHHCSAQAQKKEAFASPSQKHSVQCSPVSAPHCSRGANMLPLMS